MVLISKFQSQTTAKIDPDCQGCLQTRCSSRAGWGVIFGARAAEKPMVAMDAARGKKFFAPTTWAAEKPMTAIEMTRAQFIAP